MEYSNLKQSFTRLFVGSKTPTSKLGRSKEVRWEINSS